MPLSTVPFRLAVVPPRTVPRGSVSVKVPNPTEMPFDDTATLLADSAVNAIDPPDRSCAVLPPSASVFASAVISALVSV